MGIQREKDQRSCWSIHHLRIRIETQFKTLRERELYRQNGHLARQPSSTPRYIYQIQSLYHHPRSRSDIGYQMEAQFEGEIPHQVVSLPQLPLASRSRRYRFQVVSQCRRNALFPFKRDEQRWTRFEWIDQEISRHTVCTLLILSVSRYLSIPR